MLRLNLFIFSGMNFWWKEKGARRTQGVGEGYVVLRFCLSCLSSDDKVGRQTTTVLLGRNTG
jgi:hypothetical protein